MSKDVPVFFHSRRLDVDELDDTMWVKRSDMLDVYSNFGVYKRRNGSQDASRVYARLVRTRRDSLESRVVELAADGKLAIAARSQIHAQVRAGLPITSKRGDKVVKVFADGRTEILETIVQPSYELPKGVRILRHK